MLGSSAVTWLWILGAAGTVAFIVIMIWKSIVGLKEEDVVILDPAEDNLAAEQRETVAKVERLAFLAKTFGFTTLAILVVASILSLYHALRFTGQ
jgi:amino acid transporter